METFGDRTPEIDYPTTWSYTVIGSDDGRIRFAISRILSRAGSSPDISMSSHTSRSCLMAGAPYRHAPPW
jgi:hypothetical protein